MHLGSGARNDLARRFGLHSCSHQSVSGLLGRHASRLQVRRRLRSLRLVVQPWICSRWDPTTVGMTSVNSSWPFKSSILTTWNFRAHNGRRSAARGDLHVALPRLRMRTGLLQLPLRRFAPRGASVGHYCSDEVRQGIWTKIQIFK